MQPQPPPQESTREAVFAADVKRLRRAHAWTQTDLARAMKARGFENFHQQTIQRIEDGQRPVRLEEAYALAAELGSTVESMSHSEDYQRRTELWEITDGAAELMTRVAAAIEDWLRAAEPMAARTDSHMFNLPTTDASLAGVEIVRRVVEQARALASAAITCSSAFGRPPVDADQVLIDEELPEALREVLTQYRVPRRLRQLSFDELAHTYRPEGSHHGEHQQED